MAPTRPLALVTGASNGIGRELADQFARHGHDLVATGRSENVDVAAAELTAAHGIEVVAVRADLARRDGVEDLWRHLQRLGRPVEVAALNAGVGLGGAFLDNDLDAVLDLIALNVTSVVHLTKLLAGEMAARGRGRLLLTSSVSATLPTPYETVYGPSRAFVRMFALALREELRGSGVTVTSMLPGATDSDFHARAGMGDTAFGPDEGKNDRREVARQGYAAVMAGRAEVVAGDRPTALQVLVNKVLPETFKAHRHAGKARPGSSAG